MNAVTISGSRAGGIHRGNGQNLSVWTKRRVPALFAAPVTGGIDQLVSLVVLESGSAVAVTPSREGRANMMPRIEPFKGVEMSTKTKLKLPPKSKFRGLQQPVATKG